MHQIRAFFTHILRPVITFLYQRHRLEDVNDIRLAFVLNISLVMMSVVLLVFAALNVTVFGLHHVAVLDVLVAVLALVILIYFHLSDNVRVVAWLVVLLMTGVLLAFMAVVEYHYYAFYWLFMVPLGTIVVLGMRAGVLLSLVVVTGIAIWMYRQLDRWEGFSLESLSNIVIGSLVEIMIVAYVEAGRARALKLVEKRNQELVVQSSTDFLTGISNRRALETTLAAEIGRRNNAQLVVALLDLDYFKELNDYQGHSLGDKALQLVSRILIEELDGKLSFGRWGGDEFLLIGDNGPEEMELQVRRVMERLKVSLPELTGDSHTASIGITRYQPDESLADLIRRVDDLLYKAKQQGRGRISVG